MDIGRTPEEFVEAFQPLYDKHTDEVDAIMQLDVPDDIKNEFMITKSEKFNLLVSLNVQADLISRNTGVDVAELSEDVQHMTQEIRKMLLEEHLKNNPGKGIIVNQRGEDIKVVCKSCANDLECGE